MTDDLGAAPLGELDEWGVVHAVRVGEERVYAGGGNGSVRCFATPMLYADTVEALIAVRTLVEIGTMTLPAPDSAT